MQVSVHRFMGLAHSAQDWVGIYKGGKTLNDGSRTVAIEIAQNVTVRSWDSPFLDQSYGTLVRPYSPLAEILDNLVIGDPVAFSADLLGSVVSSDDDMVQNPRLIAKFKAIRKLDAAP